MQLQLTTATRQKQNGDGNGHGPRHRHLHCTATVTTTATGLSYFLFLFILMWCALTSLHSLLMIAHYVAVNGRITVAATPEAAGCVFRPSVLFLFFLL